MRKGRTPNAKKFSKPSGVPSRSAATDPDTGYHIITYTGPNWILDLPATSVAVWKRYDHGGDHVHCADISGPDAILIRLGSFSNPTIRLKRGMTVRRKFSSLWITSVGLTAADSTLARFRTDATLYVSTGPMFLDSGAPNPGRLERGFIGERNCVATTSSRLLMRDLWDRGHLQPDVPISVGRELETLLVRNDDLANTLYILYTLEGSAWGGSAGQTAFPILPGQTITLPLGSQMQSFQSYQFGTPPAPVTEFFEGLCVITASGTCRYSWLATANRTERINGREFYGGGGY